jgi:hypothetical protein
MQVHGLIDKCIYFAKKKRKYDLIIIHNINDDNYE